MGFFLGFREFDLRRPLTATSGAAEASASALGLAASISSAISSSDATSSCDCRGQYRSRFNSDNPLTMYFFRGFRFLLPDALTSSEFAAGVGVAEPAARGVLVPLVVAIFFGLSPATREIRRRFGVSSSCPR